MNRELPPSEKTEPNQLTFIVFRLIEGKATGKFAIGALVILGLATLFAVAFL